MSDPVRLALAKVHALTLQVLRAHGVSEAHARAMADIITAAERDDCPAHGLFRLPGYVSAVRSGTVTPDAVPEVPELAPAIVHVDGQHGFAPLALQIGRAPLAAKARQDGIAVLALTRIYHCAALGPEVEAFAAAGSEELWGASGWPQAALGEESDGLCLATSRAPTVRLCSGLERQRTRGHPVASA